MQVKVRGAKDLVSARPRKGERILKVSLRSTPPAPAAYVHRQAPHSRHFLATLGRTCPATRTVSAPYPDQTKKQPRGLLFVWCGRQDLNLHGVPPVPKTGASTIPPRPQVFIIIAGKSGFVKEKRKNFGKP